ncbi:MarR family transcriptional regulator [Alcanivorax sp. N3-2A]|nr:MarR family transcriptional regulator [Alcanivorax sp. N3-2A]|tara:strand:+ start:12408 stop:12866 length:459 start_codon:yes stop_codon:yes gene_type:complete
MPSPDSSPRNALAPLVGQVSRLWRRAVDRRLQPFGLSQATWRPLLHLSRVPAPVYQKDLANALMVESSSVVRVLDALQRQGFIERREGQDRRAKEILLTDPGRAIVDQLERISAEVRDRTLADVSGQDLATTLRVMARLRDALESERDLESQ